MIAGRRFLLTCAMTHYKHCEDWNREELIEDVERVKRLLCGEFLPAQARYEHVDLLGNSPTSVQLLDRLRDFCTSSNRRTDDYLVVYLTGHGEILEDGDYVLLASDTQPLDLQHRTVPASEIAKKALAGTKVRRLLLMLDTCYAARGSEGLGTRALRDIDRLPEFDEKTSQVGSHGIAVVASTCPYQEAAPGAFSKCLERAAGDVAAAGYAPPTLQVGALISSINQDKKKPSWQSAVCHLLGLRNGEPAFLVNPRHRAQLRGVDLLEQDRHAERQQKRAHHQPQQDDLREVFETPWFTGRHRALADLRGWLTDLTNDYRACVVTGDPGSGKTALLGLIAELSNPDRAPSVPRRGLPAGFQVPEDAVAEAIYARTLTTKQVRDRIASGAGLRGESLQELIDELNQDAGGTPIVVLVDALDEGADPTDLITGLLTPLIQHCHGRIRLLLGTRRHSLKKLLGTSDGGYYQLIDLDNETYADPASIRTYAKQILLSKDSLDSTYKPSGIYQTASKTVVDGVTGAIGAAAGNSYLVARITATTEATAVTLPDFTDPGWQASLPRLAGEAMRRDLQVRLGEKAAKAAHLLVPLAYAQGSGLPWEDIWPRLANALSPGHQYSSDDLVWLRTAAGSYVVEDLADRGSVYRLYHQARVEHLLEGRNQTADQQTIAETLLTQVPTREGGQPDWAAVHIYTRTHLATHAARARCLDTLLTDPGFLLAASRPQLLDSLDTVDSLPGRAVADAYCRAARHLRGKPSQEHPSYLQLAARYGQASNLANALDAHVLPSTWSARWASWRYQPPHQTLTGHTQPINTVAVGELKGRPVVISGGDDGTVRVWDLTTGAPIGDRFTGHTWSVTAVTVGRLKGSPVVISTGLDRTVRVWDLAKGTPIGDPFTGHGRPVTAVAVGELEGRPVVISGSDDRTVRVWDLAKGTPIGKPFTGHTDQVTAVAVGELEGRPVVISGSDDRTVRVWDLTKGTPIGKPFTGHTDQVTALAVSELEGRPVVISGSDDRTVRVWDLTTGQPRRSFWRAVRLRHSAPVRAAVLHRHHDQLLILTGCSDGTRWTWDLSTCTRVYPGEHGAAVNALEILKRNRVVFAVANVLIIGQTSQNSGDTLTIDLESEILALSTNSGSIVVAATTLGLVVLDILWP